ncbi:DUF6764 family protein [Nocardia sp. NPDC050697]|uniref:DUF6764 family protein n=1 Tax=Nocardia sp. NPDC050697 TaxID=3155158 RepID=UPI00340FB95F
MKLISAIVCSAAAVGTSLLLPGTASAARVDCASANGVDVTLIEGKAGCRAASDASGQAHATGLDGVGYASAATGARALGIGAAGGIGVSEGSAGIPIALGYGSDAIARTTITPEVPPRSLAVTVALDGSRALVRTEAGEVVCLGTAAFAWDAATGRGCVATPFGRWLSSDVPSGQPASE